MINVLGHVGPENALQRLCILFPKFLTCVLETWEQYSYYVAPYMFSDGAKMK